MSGGRVLVTDASRDGDGQRRARQKFGAWSPRIPVAVASAMTLLTAILLTLHGSVPGTMYEPFSSLPSGHDPPVPIQIGGHPVFEQDRTSFVHQTTLHARQPGRLLDHQQIALRMTAYFTNPVLREAELRFSQGCVYRPAEGATFPSDGYLVFYRPRDCARTAASEGVVLLLRFDRPVPVAVWTVPLQPSLVLDTAVIAQPFGLRQSARVNVVEGLLLDVVPDSSATRLALLTYVWSVMTWSGWIAIVIAGCATAVGAAVTLAWPAGPRRRWKLPAAGFLAALALAITYAIVFPPFQAADEPNHFLALANYFGRPELGAEARSLAARGHFEEIQFHPERHFSPLDRLRPGAQSDDGFVPDASRGIGVRVVWRFARVFLRDLPMPRLLLAMRVLHAFLFATAVAVFIALIQWLTDAEHPELVAVPLFLVPTVPYFGMFMSNYAPLLSAYVVVAAAVAVAVWDRQDSFVVGPILAVAYGCAVAISHSAIPLFPVVAAVLVAHVLLGDRSGRWKGTIVYWIGVTGVALVSAAVPLTPLSIVAGGGLLAGAELGAGAMRRKLRRGGGRGAPAIRAAATVVAAGLALLFAGSLVVSYPMLPNVGPSPPPAWTYMQKVMFACATFLRFGPPDPLTSMTFWGGFGWLDTMPPSSLIRAMATVSGLSLIALMAWTARVASARTLVIVLCLMCGFLLSAAGYAYAVIQLPSVDVHGRYLLGLYLCALVVAWSGAARIATALRPRWRRALVATVACGCLLGHVICLSVILRRYF